MDDDLEEIAAIVELLEQADFTEFHYEKGDLRIHVRRGGESVGPMREARGSTPASPPVSVTKAESEAAHARGTGWRADVNPDAEGAGIVTSPMLGTFYGAPKPGEEPFVRVGDIVEPDSVVCIIEVMKLMNSVRAGMAGEVVAVLASDGSLVEYDQALIAIRPLA